MQESKLGAPQKGPVVLSPSLHPVYSASSLIPKLPGGDFESEGFEGNEKRLEIDLVPIEGTTPIDFPRKFWDDIMVLVSATILDYQSTGSMEGYILSESSLFVTANRITLITCGTTVLLNCLEMLLRGLKEKGREVEYMQYSRKNFSFPWQQPAMHRSIAAEYTTLKTNFPAGSPYILGPLDKDHYFTFVMDNINRDAREEIDMQLNIVMYDICEDVSKQFYSDRDSTTSELTATIRKNTGLARLFDSCEVVQDQVWVPCGYSANAMSGVEYWTTHITPEQHCSYASFETNAAYPSYTPLVTEVLEIFKPKKCTLIMLIDEESLAGQTRRRGETIGDTSYDGYTMAGRALNEFGPGYYCIKTDLLVCP